MVLAATKTQLEFCQEEKLSVFTQLLKLNYEIFRQLLIILANWYGKPFENLKKTFRKNDNSCEVN